MPHVRYDQAGLARHAIGVVEAEDVLYDGWTRRKPAPEGFEVHGRSLEGRLLALAVAVRDGDVWVLGGRELDEAERARYRRRRFKQEAEPGMTRKKGEDALPPRRIQTHVLGLRMDDDTMRWLEQVAERRGVSASLLARTWVMEGLGREAPPETR